MKCYEVSKVGKVLFLPNGCLGKMELLNRIFLKMKEVLQMPYIIPISSISVKSSPVASLYSSSVCSKVFGLKPFSIEILLI